MTEVLPIPSQPDGSFFNPFPLRRTASQSSLFLHQKTSYPTRSSEQKPTGGFENRFSSSLPSSAPSSPRITHFEHSAETSYTSTPSSLLSLDDEHSTEDDEEGQDDIAFPDYDDEKNLRQGSCLHVELDTDSESESESVSEAILTPPSSRPDTRLFLVNSGSSARPLRPKVVHETNSTEDDTAAKREPTSHVDYLSHSWAEEDIWASWRYIISNRKVFGNSMRLENAAWRSWTKSKYHFATIEPGQLNWEKDHDVTWLYGPLQTGSGCLQCASACQKSQLSRSDSFACKKPILKKRSLSEVILQRSLAPSNLIKRATDALGAQQPERNWEERTLLKGRALSDVVTRSQPKSPDGKPISSPRPTLRSAMTSGAQTPCTERHIHFNNKVEQCIAINKGGGRRYDYFGAVYDDSSSEDEPLTMKMIHRSRSGFRKPRNSFSGESQTIARLPATTLNYRGDTPEPVEQKSRQSASFRSASPKISPCPSQQTIMPRTPSATSFVSLGGVGGDDDDDDDEEGTNLERQPSIKRRDSLFLGRRQASFKDDDDGSSSKNDEDGSSSKNDDDRSSSKTDDDGASSNIDDDGASSNIDDYGASSNIDDDGASSKNDDDGSSSSDAEPGAGLRRTSSGIFMLYQDEDEEEESFASAGLVEKVVYVVNTIKDITTVFWNSTWLV